ncbi:MAG: ABC transporter permease [Polyangiaceae bacterium]|nr:ABC transporter permease [Polyangiaceae bacterium]
MKAFLIARRELNAVVRSPMGAIIISVTLLINGLLFYNMVLTEKLLSGQVLEQFFYYTSGPMMLAAVALSMRLLAEERQNGTVTLLNTSPISDRDIVLGKFLGALVVLAVMVLFTLYMPALIFVNGKVSIGHIAVGYLGLLLLGAAVLSIGLFASSLTRHQIIAVVIAAAILVPWLVLWKVAQLVDAPVNKFLNGFALHHQNFRTFQTGVLRLDSVVYYVAVTYFFLLAATKVLEARRWR